MARNTKADLSGSVRLVPCSKRSPSGLRSCENSPEPFPLSEASEGHHGGNVLRERLSRLKLEHQKLLRKVNRVGQAVNFLLWASQRSTNKIAPERSASRPRAKKPFAELLHPDLKLKHIALLCSFVRLLSDYFGLTRRSKYYGTTGKLQWSELSSGSEP